MQRYRSPVRLSGFTLVEILIVMAIIGMLAVMVAPNLFRQREGALRDAALSQISALETALDAYRLDVGEYPDSLDGLMENDSGRAARPACRISRSSPIAAAVRSPSSRSPSSRSGTPRARSSRSLA